MYTSQITFATIGLQGATTTTTKESETSGSPPSTSNPPQNSEAVGPPPSKTAAMETCSPKSVYALASKVHSPSPGCRRTAINSLVD